MLVNLVFKHNDGFFNVFLLAILLFLSCANCTSESSVDNLKTKPEKNMRVAIIGAGAAGLCAARHCTDPAFAFSCEVFEQMEVLGGTWVYTERTGVDDYGIPIHTSMYKDLITNLPKELMSFPDFEFPNYDRSFITQEQVLKYLHDYADHFKLQQYIRFRHHIKEVRPLPNDKWAITITNLVKKETVTKEFDAVVVCNGHYTKPIIPVLEGQHLFAGLTLHSHDYRVPQLFENKTVLVVGAGPSGIDITDRIAKCAAKVILSHRRTEVNNSFDANIFLKPKTVRFTKDSAFFDDGSSEKIDAVVYCTGFTYDYPFLTNDSGIVVKDNNVSLLYKHSINIEKPTMTIIGLMFANIPFAIFDYQVIMFLKHLNGDIQLPSKPEMIADTEEEMQLRKSKGYPQRYAHKLGFDFHESYLNDLADIAQVKRFSPEKLKAVLSIFSAFGF